MKSLRYMRSIRFKLYYMSTPHYSKSQNWIRDTRNQELEIPIEESENQTAEKTIQYTK